MKNTGELKVQTPTLPSGGGAITGAIQSSVAGPDGAVALTLPLPITPGRGYAPPLSLNYSSLAGNGPFGIGWSATTMAISRRTHMGVPNWDEHDEFLAPDGEVLVPCLDDNGAIITETRNNLLGTKLENNYRVTTLQPRVISDFSFYEHWQPLDDIIGNDFWVIVMTDGQMHLLGHDEYSRIADPAIPQHIARWLLCASVNATGEQIFYKWRPEDEAGCDNLETAAHPNATAQRYLHAVYYGNIIPGRTFPCLHDREARDTNWLFMLVFDYGERSMEPECTPDFYHDKQWVKRPDCFSSLEYGFNLRTRRLCRQIIMFHRLNILAGNTKEEDIPVAVARLLLTFKESKYISMLTSVQQVANNEDETFLSLPPQLINWYEFKQPKEADWLAVDMGNYCPQQPWQYIDLMGEGIAGLLWQDSGAWWYRAQVRQIDSNDKNAVVLGPAQPLSGIPSLRQGAALTDINGSGQLQWLVSDARVSGYYSQADTMPEQWLQFTPLDAMPLEFHHPQAQLEDLTGSGFADLVLIGPRSVRLYAGKDGAWSKGKTVLQSGDVNLPIPGADPAALVAFSDIMGSGKQHLVQICASGVTCWPNIGHGRFGQPITLPGFSLTADTFNPDQIFLADVDGSGMPDIIYAMTDKIKIWRNQSGNSFAAPINLSLPAGVHYDRTCRLQVADTQGLGVASILLTIPHPVPRNYVLHLAKEKPWLLHSVNTSTGMNQTFRYRSSVQFWLDEKNEACDPGDVVPRCHLPFPIHTLWQTKSHDEITGNTLTQEIRYRFGVWDGNEREFRGFGYVESRDTDTASVVSSKDSSVVPSRICQWFSTGLLAVDNRMSASFWDGDDDAFNEFTPRYTTGSGMSEKLCSKEQMQTYAFWLHRASKGQLLRREVYALDSSAKHKIPYTVTEQRLQNRLIGEGDFSAVWPSIVESRTYHYERIAADPQCQQQVTLESDVFGLPLRNVMICYPRRPKPDTNPYLDTIPENIFSGSYDTQQQMLRLTLTQTSWHHLTNSELGHWCIGLSDSVRQDIFEHAEGTFRPNGLSLEDLKSTEGLVSDKCKYEIVAQQQTFWISNDNVPAFPPRQINILQAKFDCNMAAELVYMFPYKDNQDLLTDAGYEKSEYLFTRAGEEKLTLWAVSSGETRFLDEESFWLPFVWRDSPLTGWNSLKYDPYFCVVTSTQDSTGLNVNFQYDWRFLSPVMITDKNNNCHYVSLDALGRVNASWFTGTESGVRTGFRGYGDSVPPLVTVEAALDIETPLPVLHRWVYVTDSWTKSPPLPPHVVMLTADRYGDDKDQQIRQQVVFSDGFGRILQTAGRSVAGKAWHLTEDGKLDGFVNSETGPRWVVSGRTEYDSKGQPVRTYQPYFLDSWRYVSDHSARRDLYADTHVYDPPGREIQVMSALKNPKTHQPYFRQVTITPWFTVVEDENDTQ